MPTLHVRNVPRDLYAALRKRAKANNRSIASEVRAVLAQNVPTAKELKARKEFTRKLLKLTATKPKSRGPFPSAEEMIREDRER